MQYSCPECFRLIKANHPEVPSSNREQRGLSQKGVAQKANVTQQQLSKVENGINCNLTTFLKVCNALDLKIDLDPVCDKMPLEKV